MDKVKVELAKGKDDDALNKILKENEMQGRISIAFGRKPSYFKALDIEGYVNQTIVGRQKNKIIGFGTRSLRKCFVNGKIKDIGYLSNLRIAKNYKGKGYLRLGYEFLKSLHQDKKISLYYSTIVEDNKTAINILTNQKPYLPAYRDMGRYCTFAVSLFGKKKNFSTKLKIIKGSDKNILKIVNFLRKAGSKKQFYPYYTINDFNEKFRHFDIRDFYIAMKEDKIVGIIAKWDQRKFRQIIVKNYNGLIYFLKPIYNSISKLLNYSRLPNPNSRLNFFYVSFIAIEGNDNEIFRELILALYNDNARSDFSHFLVGLHSRDKLAKTLDSFAKIKFNSRLFAVYWNDGEKTFKELDSRIPYVELSTL